MHKVTEVLYTYVVTEDFEVKSSYILVNMITCHGKNIARGFVKIVHITNAT